MSPYVLHHPITTSSAVPCSKALQNLPSQARVLIRGGVLIAGFLSNSKSQNLQMDLTLYRGYRGYLSIATDHVGGTVCLFKLPSPYARFHCCPDSFPRGLYSMTTLGCPSTCPASFPRGLYNMTTLSAGVSSQLALLHTWRW